ncbi:ATP-binding protein [Thermodesulfovibrionales bacterium]|nr:ATP-binding protein [Thermodesulfovibrionales bacterium]
MKKLKTVNWNPSFKSRLPYLKNIEEFDFSYQPGLKEREVIRLNSLKFIDERVM